ncbi:MAG: gluconokinase [Thermofilum sp.]
MPVLAVDIGTSTIKAAVVDFDRGILASASEEIPLTRPEPGAAEHDPQLLLNKFKSVVSRVAVEEVEALALSGYLFGLVPLGKGGTPLSGVITWLDRRPAEAVSRILERVSPRELYEKTGCPPLGIYQLAKIVWLRERKEKTYREAEAFLDAKGFIVYNLLGEKLMDRSSASGSQLLNIRKLEWEYELLEELGVDAEKLPELEDSVKVVGEIPADRARELGLRSSTSLVLGVFDGAAVSVGEGALGRGVASSHLSTSTMLRVAHSEPLVDRFDEMRFQTYYLFDGVWLPGGAVNSAGVVLRWFRDNMGQVERMVARTTGLDPYDLLAREAEAAPPGSGGLLFLPYISGERFPTFGNYATGVLFGLKEHHTRSHVVRSFMEGVMLNLRLVAEALRENGLQFSEVRVTGGGARSRLWLQIMADVLEVPVKASVKGDAALWGTSLLALKATGSISDVARAAEEKFTPDLEVKPDEENTAVYREAFRKFEKLLSAVKPLFRELSA